ncbi:MAG: anti-sigma factor [Dokdonella sp.]
MNTTDPQTGLPEDANPAAEYVLGVLSAKERREVESRLVTDSALAAEVARWEQRFEPLIGEISAVAVPDYVWERIRFALSFTAETRSPVATQQAEPGFWASLSLWRTLAGAGFAATAALAIALLGRPPVIETPAPLVVTPPPVVKPLAPRVMASTLAHDDGTPGYVAAIDASTGTMTVTPVIPGHDDGRVPELWLIPEGQAALSLGVVDRDKPLLMNIPESMRGGLGPQALLAITLEPPGGAPQGVATGPIIAKGGIALL